MEITFYNKKGQPQIYLSDEEENTFYTWDGHAVAYLFDDKIYGWKGKHIGWYHEGVIYDLYGYKVGSIEEKCLGITYVAKVKFVKYTKYNRFCRCVPQSKPLFSLSYCDMSLIDFITQNRI
jgi:hypothetical protein